MQPSTRRQVLRLAPATAGLVAGCSTVLPPPSGDDGDSPVSALSADALVVRQATDAHPPTVELGLTNVGDESVPVVAREGGGLPMEYLPAPETGLFVFPVEPEHVFVSGPDLPTAPSDDCWRVPDGAAVAVENLGFHVTLDPGERYAIRHRVYDASPGDAGPDVDCYPSGTNHLTAPLELAEQMENGPAFDLEYALSFEESGDLSIVVSGPEEPRE